ncbi:MAG TPA: DUF1203 domain-containing protein [Hyphomicrobiaceae bacterium]|nr:DUF1203 domain-containing protein [Hyphomicrobiaceae bacterium]
MAIRFVALETELVDALRRGAPDANGQAPERHLATDDGLPCRHCLADIRKGESYLIVSHRPFPAPQPYAEQGPIFLHAAACPRGGGNGELPAFLDSPTYIVRGYGANNRIVYGSGEVVATAEILAAAEKRFADPKITYVHVRSATNNCFHCRIERA